MHEQAEITRNEALQKEADDLCEEGLPEEETDETASEEDDEEGDVISFDKSGKRVRRVPRSKRGTRKFAREQVAVTSEYYMKFMKPPSSSDEGEAWLSSSDDGDAGEKGDANAVAGANDAYAGVSDAYSELENEWQQLWDDASQAWYWYNVVSHARVQSRMHTRT